MTDNNHPITPPNELVKQWINEGHCQDYCSPTTYLTSKVAQWGYEQRGAVNEAELQKARDEELEACCKVIDAATVVPLDSVEWLRNARRPKPPSLKERIATAMAHGDTSIALALLDQALPD